MDGRQNLCRPDKFNKDEQKSLSFIVANTVELESERLGVNPSFIT